MNETSGVLRPVITTYLNGGPMSPEQCATMRAYLRQWIMHPGWVGPGIAELRARIDSLTTRKALSKWLDDALAAGIEPL